MSPSQSGTEGLGSLGVVTGMELCTLRAEGKQVETRWKRASRS